MVTVIPSKSGTLATRLILVAIVSWPLALLCSCSSERLGHSYRLVHRSVDSRQVEGAFEGFAHYSDLYSGSDKLGTVGQFSISPSGRFALFENNGRRRLFDRTTRQTRDVTDGSFALPRHFTWNEVVGVVEVTYYDNHPPSRIELPR